MEAEAEGANSNRSRRITRSAITTKKKRKPLSDLTNLIPSSIIHKPSIPIPKPYNSNFKPHKPGLNSSKSDSSIGSSNYNNNNNNNNKNAPNRSTVPSTPHSSFVVPGDRVRFSGSASGSYYSTPPSRKVGKRKAVGKAQIGVAKVARPRRENWPRTLINQRGLLVLFFVFLEEFGTTFKKENPIVKAVSALATNQSFTASTPSEVAHS